MKSQHLSAQPGPVPRAGPPCSRQGTLLRHSLFTGTNHGWTLAPPLESLPPGSQASQVHAPTAQPSPCEDGPVSTCHSEGLDRREGHGAHRAAGPTPSLQPSDPQTSGLGFARDPQREAQKAKHPCPWLQTPPRPPPDSLGPPCQNHHKLLSPHLPLTLPCRRLGLRESLKTRGLEGPRAPYSPGTDHRPLEICTYGLSQPNSPRTAITTCSRHPHPFLVSQHFPTAVL